MTMQDTTMNDSSIYIDSSRQQQKDNNDNSQKNLMSYEFKDVEKNKNGHSIWRSIT
jgi:hypothetical protein